MLHIFMKKLLIITQVVDVDDENLGFFHRWIEEFSKRAEHVVVLASRVRIVALPANVSVHSFGERKTRLGRLWRYWELFSYHYVRSDAVFFHMIPEFVLAATPFLISLKRTTGLWYVHKSVTHVLRIAEKFVDFIFTASELSFRLPSKKVLYTGHAIDSNLFKPHESVPVSSDVVRFLVLGRISPVKDIETVIRACEVLQGKWDRQWSLSIVGGPLMPRDEEYLASLKKMVSDKGLEERIRFVGSKPYTEIPALYRSHDIFISMSTTGSIDKSVLEAMASGLTVITTNEAFRSLLPSSHFLAHKGPEFLAERMKALSGESRPNMALRELVVQNHSLEKTIGKIVVALQEKF